MSQENVELVRRADEAFNEGDPSVFLERYAPDIVLSVSSDLLLETGPVMGAAEVEKSPSTLRVAAVAWMSSTNQR